MDAKYEEGILCLKQCWKERKHTITASLPLTPSAKLPNLSISQFPGQDFLANHL